jgi:hypothetical protein
MQGHLNAEDAKVSQKAQKIQMKILIEFFCVFCVFCETFALSAFKNVFSPPSKESQPC